MASSRYALYFAPPVESALWQHGSAWLGRDAARGIYLRPPAIANIRPETLLAFTQHPRRYGFHATLKAPFHLADGRRLPELLEDVEQFARQQASFALPPLKVAPLDDFLALVPSQASARIQAMERRCVANFDRYRRPLTPAQLSQRRAKGLSPLEDEMLVRWGYPHVFDCYRFHMTLTDSTCGMHARFLDQVRSAAEQTFHGPPVEECTFDAISVFEEVQPGADFRLLRRVPLGRRGRLIYVVGPSGAGKDSILRWVRDHTLMLGDVMFPRRVITRAQADATEQHEAMGTDKFAALVADGGLALHWEANGLQYGIRTDVCDALDRGMTVVVNGSRAHVAQAMSAFPQLELVHVVAPEPVLERRLRERGRESAEQIAARRARAWTLPIDAPKVTEIMNDGALAKAGAALLNVVRGDSSDRH